MKGEYGQCLRLWGSALSVANQSSLSAILFVSQLGTKLDNDSFFSQKRGLRRSPREITLDRFRHHWTRFVRFWGSYWIFKILGHVERNMIGGSGEIMGCELGIYGSPSFLLVFSPIPESGPERLPPNILGEYVDQ